MIDFRLAHASDLDRIAELIEQAKAHLKKLGVDQWQQGYPNRATLEGDLAARDGYVMTEQDAVVGYACVTFGDEESYKSLKGTWLSNQPYAAIHRMAIDDAYKGRGLASRVLQYAETLCTTRNVHSIKVDTDENNAAMKRLLERNGYTYCGIVRFDDSDKIAYEKLV